MTRTLVALFSDQCGHCTDFKQSQLAFLRNALAQRGVNLWTVSSPTLVVAGASLTPPYQMGGAPGVSNKSIADQMVASAKSVCNGWPSFVLFTSPQSPPLLYSGASDFRQIVNWIDQNASQYLSYSSQGSSSSIGGGVRCRGGYCQYGN